MDPLIFVVILNWNGRKDTLECLDSLLCAKYANYRIIVADNASSDGSVEAIRHSFPSVQVVVNEGNLGFAEGNNRGIARALEGNADFVLLLNNDTVVDPDILGSLIEAAKRMPNGGVFGPKMYYHSQPNRLWYAGGYWDVSSLSFGEYGAGEEDVGQYDVLAETEWVIGCAMFVRVEVFRRIGLLEPMFFLNNEEIDFCSRARRAGYSCVYVPKARLWHKISVSFGGEFSPLKEYFSARNRLLWARRNAIPSLRFRIYIKSLKALVKRFVSPVFFYRRPSLFNLKKWWWNIHGIYMDPRNRAHFAGFRDFWLGRFGDCPNAVRELAREWAARQAAKPKTTAKAQGTA